MAGDNYHYPQHASAWSASRGVRALQPGHTALSPQGADRDILPADQGLVGEFPRALSVGVVQVLAGGDERGDRANALHAVAARIGVRIKKVDGAQPKQLLLTSTGAGSLILPFAAAALALLLALLGTALGSRDVCPLSEEPRSHQPGEGYTARPFGGHEATQGRELFRSLACSTPRSAKVRARPSKRSASTLIPSGREYQRAHVPRHAVDTAQAGSARSAIAAQAITNGTRAGGITV
ncbi:MAG: hypothetical protein K0Q71_4931 [Thermomicrobiales bacterium]|nr:hypothetical protein [Thermomicrobiales bacterium]